MADVAKVDGVNIDDIAKINLMDVPAGGALAEDIVGSSMAGTAAGNSGTYYVLTIAINAGADEDLATLNQAYDASSLAVGVAFFQATASKASSLKGQIIMDGVMVAETTFIPNTSTYTRIAIGTKALSGSKNCIARVHNYDAGSVNYYAYSGFVSVQKSAGVAVGSVKLV